MAKNTSILLGSHFENFINRELTSGRYNSASEVIRSALRLLEIEEQKTIQLKQELVAGEKSKIVKNFDDNNIIYFYQLCELKLEYSISNNLMIIIEHRVENINNKLAKK